MQAPRKRLSAWLSFLVVSVGLVQSTLRAAEPGQPIGTAPAEAATKAPLKLADLEEMALQNNPTLAQATAIIEASKGKALQAGLCPNPTVGYQGEQIGIKGTAGELQGAFIQQEIVTAGKLRLSRAKYQQEAVMAEIQAQVQQYRVLNGVRVQFWDVLTAQQQVVVRGNLRIAEDAERTTAELVKTGENGVTSFFQRSGEPSSAAGNNGPRGSASTEKEDNARYSECFKRRTSDDPIPCGRSETS